MSQTVQADVVTAEAAHERAPIDPKSYLFSWAVWSVAGLSVLAVLAQALVSFLAPTV